MYAKFLSACLIISMLFLVSCGCQKADNNNSTSDNTGALEGDYIYAPMDDATYYGSQMMREWSELERVDWNMGVFKYLSIENGVLTFEGSLSPINEIGERELGVVVEYDEYDISLHPDAEIHSFTYGEDPIEETIYTADEFNEIFDLENPEGRGLEITIDGGLITELEIMAPSGV